MLRETNIHYFSRTDARSTPLQSQSIDYYTSVAVLEHIPPAVLRDIWQETHRLLRPDGLAFHWFDPKDHFAVSDPSITAINFLQFDDATWHRYAGNRFMYHNRLRVDDYIAMLEQAGFTVVDLYRKLDERSLAALEAGFQVHAQFADKSFHDLATGSVHVLARP